MLTRIACAVAGGLTSYVVDRESRKYVGEEHEILRRVGVIVCGVVVSTTVEKVIRSMSD